MMTVGAEHLTDLTDLTIPDLAQIEADVDKAMSVTLSLDIHSLSLLAESIGELSTHCLNLCAEVRRLERLGILAG